MNESEYLVALYTKWYMRAVCCDLLSTRPSYNEYIREHQSSHLLQANMLGFLKWNSLLTRSARLCSDRADAIADANPGLVRLRSPKKRIAPIIKVTRRSQLDSQPTY